MDRAREPERPRPDDVPSRETADAGAVRCPYCKADLAEGALVGECAACATVHHLQCFGDHGGCSTHGCGSTRARTKKVGEPAGAAPFTASTCYACRQAIPAQAMVARCSGCSNALHVACFEHVKGCPLALTGACRGAVELMTHAEAAAHATRRRGQLVAGVCVGLSLVSTVALALVVLDGGEAERVAWFGVAALLLLLGAVLSVVHGHTVASRLEAVGRAGRRRTLDLPPPTSSKPSDR